MHLHKWVEVDSQPKYKYYECKKCKGRKVEEIPGGYQPMKHPNWATKKLKGE